MQILQKEKQKRASENKIKAYRPYTKQLEFHKNGLIYRERLLRAGNQLGKAQPINEPVLTPCGWKPIGSLSAGDEIIAGDGTVTRVTGVFPQGNLDVFRLTFDDGAQTRCCENHLWAARLRKRERFGAARADTSKWPVYSLKQIRAFGGDQPAPIRRAVIPVPRNVQLPEYSVPLDPYLLGVLLGDGCFRGCGVSFSSADQEIIDQVSSVLPPECRLVAKCGYDFGIVAAASRPGLVLGRFEKTNPIIAAVKALGLHGKMAHEKWVPSEYLWNSPDVRLAVLQGLMDTDGSVSTDGAIEFSSTSKQLADDVVFLVRSFGGKIKIEQRQTYAVSKNGDRKAGRISWRLRIRLPHVQPFRLKRKLERLIRPVSTTDYRVLYKIDPAGKADCVCIAVEHPSRTYVTNDFIVTHNTYSGAAEMAFHLTGDYPAWWPGRKWSKPVKAWAGGKDSTSVRDSLATLLLGPPEARGTGSIPKATIEDIVRAQGIRDAVDAVVVRHKSGGSSRLGFKSYDQGRERWQASTLDLVWLDEEPPLDIYTEALSRTNATNGCLYMTFTPLMGMSQVVMRFLTEQSPDRADTNMTIEDAEHISPEARARIIASYPAHEREARTLGTPMLGSGRIFPVEESSIAVDAFPIPAHWTVIGALDFGWDHPTAAIRLAWDRDADAVYVTHAYRRREAVPAMHAAALKPWGDEMPWAWPHDGLQHDKGSGEQLAAQYRNAGLKMLPERAQYEGERGSGVEAGLMDMLERMETERFKVFRHLAEWFEEFRLYHRQDGKVVKEHDDLMSATRYGVMSLRFGKAAGEKKKVLKPRDPVRLPYQGGGAWMG